MPLSKSLKTAWLKSGKKYCLCGGNQTKSFCSPAEFSDKPDFLLAEGNKTLKQIYELVEIGLSFLDALNLLVDINFEGEKNENKRVN